MKHTPAQIIAEYLQTKSIFDSPEDSVVTWPLYISHLPAIQGANIDAAAIADTMGMMDGRIMRTGEVIEHPGLQLRVRCSTFETGYAKIKAAADELATIAKSIVTLDEETYSVCNVSRSSSILPMGVDPDNERAFLFSVNFLVTIQ